MSSFRNVVEKLVQQGDSLLSCSVCRTPTNREMLANYGARCFHCYEAYCAEGETKTPQRDTPQQAEMRTRLKPRPPRLEWSAIQAKLEKMRRNA